MKICSMNAECVLGILLLLTAVGTAQTNLSKDELGWTIFTLSEDARIAYVSSSTGNDENARTYGTQDSEIGADPFLPEGQIKPFATLSAAFDSVRDGMPDWVLLKKGDVWYDAIHEKRSGRSQTERFLISAWGEGNTRPTIKTGGDRALNSGCGLSNLAIVGIHFYASQADPASPDYTGESNSSLRFICDNPDQKSANVLIEDCYLHFHGAIVQGYGHENFEFRRNVIADNYSTTGHSSGIFAKHNALLLEENVFDHNGWLKQGSKSEGGATIFNHNIYFSTCSGSIIRNNIFLRSSSIQVKLRSDGIEGARDIVVENNLIVDGEIGIGYDARSVPDSDSVSRFHNNLVKNNVLIDIGKSRPTERTLCWYIGGLVDWTTGVMSGNLLLHQRHTGLGNLSGIGIGGPRPGRWSVVGTDILIEKNVIHGLYGNKRRGVLRLDNNKKNVTIRNNTFARPLFGGSVVDVSNINGIDTLDGYSFSGNHYYTKKDPDEWFKFGDAYGSFGDWKRLSGEENAVDTLVEFVDTTRSLSTYMASLGMDTAYQSFIDEVRKQSKDNWRPAFTAPAINDWFRAGFTPKGASLVRPKATARGTLGRGVQNAGAYYTISGRMLSASAIKTMSAGRCGGGVLIFIDHKGNAKPVALKKRDGRRR